MNDEAIERKEREREREREVEMSNLIFKEIVSWYLEF